jgi:hypothetical protein
MHQAKDLPLLLGQVVDQASDLPGALRLFQGRFRAQGDGVDHPAGDRALPLFISGAQDFQGLLPAASQRPRVIEGQVGGDPEQPRLERTAMLPLFGAGPDAEEDLSQ